MLALGINENERYFLEFDFYRINQFGHFEKYYFIELHGASIIALQMNFDIHSGQDTECITVAYDYIRGNKEIVTNFMKDSGITKERTIEQYMEGIYLNDRVSVETMNKGKLAYQNQAPGNWQGNWYSLNKNTPPNKLGINPEGNLHGTDTKVSKVTATYQSQQPVKMLRSTANPALDTWSVPDRRRRHTMVQY